MHDRAREIVRTARRIAILGLSPNPSRPSYGVAAYLQSAGYQIIPIRPDGGSILGEPVAASVSAAAGEGPIDIVDVFRRSEYLPEHLADIIAARPRLVWLQLGIRNDAVVEALEQAGIPVVQDLCLKVEHHHWGL